MGLTLSFPSIFVNSVSFFPILVGRWPTSSFSGITSPGYCDDPGADLRAEKEHPEFRHDEMSPRRKLLAAGSDNSTWVPFLVFQFLLTDPEAEKKLSGGFHQTKW